MTKFKLGLIVGSNRRESINRKLAQALVRLGADRVRRQGHPDRRSAALQSGFRGRLAGERHALQIRHRGVRCPAVRHPRAQPLDPRAAQERYRLGRAALGQDLLARQAGRRHRHLGRRHLHRHRPAASARRARRPGPARDGRRSLYHVQARSHRRAGRGQRRQRAELSEELRRPVRRLRRQIRTPTRRRAAA